MVLSLFIMIFYLILLFSTLTFFLNNIYIQYEFILLKKQNYKISNSPSKQNIKNSLCENFSIMIYIIMGKYEIAITDS